MKQHSFFTPFLLIATLFFVACTPQLEQSQPEVALAEQTAVPRATIAIDRPTATLLPSPSPTPSPTIVPTKAPSIEETPVATSAPRLVSRDPAPVELTNLLPQITLTFDQPMNPDSVTEALSVIPAIPLILDWQDETTLIITPERDLVLGTNYHFELDKTASGIHGDDMQMAHEWRYQVEKVIGHISWPSVSTTDDDIVIYFNYALDSETAVPQFSPTFPHTTSWNNDNTQLTIQPENPLLSDRLYTVTFADGLLDSDGITLPTPAEETYKLHSIIGTVIPHKLENVHPITTIQIPFHRPMDTELTKAAFNIEPSYPGQLEWHDNLLEFHPLNNRLPAETTITITIAESARDAEGNPVFASDVSWTFQTGEMTDQASFGIGANSQIVPLTGERAIQFSYPSNKIVPVTFELHQLDMARWLNDELVSAGYVRQWDSIKNYSSQSPAPIAETFLPEDLPAGAYLLNLYANDFLDSQLAVFLTDHAVTVHHDGEQVVVWTANLFGEILGETAVQIYANEQLLHEGLLDRTGILTFPTTQNDLKIIARTGEETTVSGLIGSWNTYSTNQDSHTSINLYTSRPIYRPNETVQFRAILRQAENVLPFGSEVTVELINPEWETVQTAVFHTSHFGTIFGEFKLNDTAINGRYQLIAHYGNNSDQHYFDIANDSAPNTTIQVETDTNFYALGQEIVTTITVQTNDGQPIANQPVRIQLFENGGSTGCFGSADFDSFWFMGDGFNTATETDENGRIQLNIPTKPSYNYHYIQDNSNLFHSIWAINASTLLPNGDEANGFTVIEVGSSSVEPKLDYGSHIKTAGQPFAISGTIADFQGNSYNGRYQTITLMGYNRSDYDYSVAIQTVSVAVGEDGRFQTQLTVQTPGEYRLRLNGKDLLNNDYFIAQPIYVFHPDIPYSGLEFDNSEYNRLELKADGQDYTVGETVRLLIQSKFSGPALLTIGQAQLQEARSIQLTAPATIVEMPLAELAAPTAHITVQAWDEQLHPFDPQQYYSWESVPARTLQTASIHLSVSDPTKVANVTITPDKESYVAGETAVFTLRVTNHKDEPISAELDLAMIDDAIFSQYSPHTSPLLHTFHNYRPNLITSGHSLAPRRILYEEFYGGCGCGGWWGADAYPTTDFHTNTRWFPSLVTDANGEVTLTVTMPTISGDWRLTTKAITADTQVSETHITISTD